ncbi:MAG TPA: putative lipid II flippase FtsW [Miltoncostaeales bacterium]|nr:putative lipid II flippase FtsW [Miltoncostaeales bacterium]
MAPRPSPRTRKSSLTKDARVLFGLVLFLVSFGIVMIYSATSAQAIVSGGDQFGIVSRQVLYAGLGMALLWAFTHMETTALARLARPAMAVAVVLLIALHVAPPTIAPTIGGATRWIVLGGFQLQPSEVAKLALIMWIASMVARDPRITRSADGLKPIALVTALLAVLIVTEPDLGTASIVVAIAFAMVFVGGAPIKVLSAAAGVCVALAGLMIAVSPYQQSRIVSFLNPWKDQYGGAFQAAQAQIALGSGGVFGRGLGNGIEKYNYLPEAHTDMIGAIIGEELGLIGLAIVIMCFVAIGVLGLRIARTSTTAHQRILAVGATTMVCLQGAINIAQVIGAFPITGVPLPFVSYGGTNLLVSLMAIGILINISKQGAHATRRGARPGTQSGDRSGRNRGTRQTGPRDRRRIAS